MKFLVFLPYRCYIPNLVKIGPVVHEKKILMHDGRRTTTACSFTSLQNLIGFLFILPFHFVNDTTTSSS